MKLTDRDSVRGKVDSNINDRVKGTDVRIASNNIYFWEWTGLPIKERCNILYNSFQLMDPDVILLQEVSSYWHETMDESVNEMGYQLVPTDNKYVKGVTEIQNYTPIWYRSDKLTLLDYGYNNYSSVSYRPDGDLSTSKSYTWALFKNASGNKFVCVSTHFTWAPKDFVPSPNDLLKSDAEEAVGIVKDIENKYSKTPIILIGDLNCYKNSDPYNILNKSLIDIRNLARSFNNADYGSYHEVGKMPIVDGKAIDHAFINGSYADILQYQFVVNEWSINSTDHIPVLLDVSLK